MKTEVFMTIATSIISILGVVITAYVIPYIKSKLSDKQWERLVYWTTVAVRCADQLFTKEEWGQKKKYVMSFITDVVNKLGINLSEQDINILIEGIVNEIHHGGPYDSETDN